MIFSSVVYDAQFSFVNIYKVGKCMMPSVLKICSDWKSFFMWKNKSLKKLNFYGYSHSQARGIGA